LGKVPPQSVARERAASVGQKSIPGHGISLGEREAEKELEGKGKASAEPDG